MRRRRNSESDPPVAEGSARVVGRVDYKVKNMEVDGDQIKLQVWDTAGQERFRNIAPVYFRGADGLMLVFDVCNETSFENVRNWLTDIERHVEKQTVVKMLVGNKADRAQEEGAAELSLEVAEGTAEPEPREVGGEGEEGARAVSDARAKALAAEFGMIYIDTSAKENRNISEAFTQLAVATKRAKEAAPPPASRAAGGRSSEVQPLVLTGSDSSSAEARSCCA